MERNAVSKKVRSGIRAFASGVCMAVLSSGGLAQQPSHVGNAPFPKGSLIAPGEHARPAGGALLDTLYLTDQQIYDTGNGDAWSGMLPFGAIYDLQVADEFQLSLPHRLTEVTADYVTFFGFPPAEGVVIGLFAKAGLCRPEESAERELAVESVGASSFSDTVFGLLGMRLHAALPQPASLSAGTWFISIQPKDRTATGDWFYVLRSTAQQTGCPCFLRDGGRAETGYGWTSWKSGEESGYGDGDVAMRILGEPAGGIENDHCTGAIELQSGNVLVGTTVGADMDEGYPSCGQGTEIIAPSVWYRLIGTGEEIRVDACGSEELDTKLTVYADSCDPTLARCIGGNHNCDCGDDASFTWETEPGRDYFIAVHGTQGQEGPFQLSASVNPGGSAIPCEDILDLAAECQGRGTLTITVRLRNRCHTGKFIVAHLDGEPLPPMRVEGQRAELRVTTNAGQHRIKLLAPPCEGIERGVTCMDTRRGDRVKEVPVVDLIIYQSQNGPALSEAREDTVGAFTVANLNDTDADGIIDVEDDWVINNSPGRPEVDLMKLVLKTNSDDPFERFRLELISGHARLWRSFAKGVRVELPADFVADELPQAFWIEAIRASEGVRDIQLKLSSLDRAESDVVKATGIWAVRYYDDYLHDRWTSDEVFEHWPTITNPPKSLIVQDGTIGLIKIGHGFPAKNTSVMRFLIIPDGIHLESDVLIDATRRQSSVGYVQGNDDSCLEDEPQVAWPVGDELPNGDDLKHSVDMSRGDEFFVYQSLIRNIPDGPQWAVSRINAQEFLRVGFNGTRPTDNAIAGSRCSPKYDWHATHWLVQRRGTWKRLNGEREIEFVNDIAPGHIITVLNHCEPVIDFLEKYEAGSGERVIMTFTLWNRHPCLRDCDWIVTSSSPNVQFCCSPDRGTESIAPGGARQLDILLEVAEGITEEESVILDVEAAVGGVFLHDHVELLIGP